MKRLLLLLCVSSLPLRAYGFSTVFAGDPINPSTGAPYEVMPGFPLIEPGVDGILGTSDDVITPATIGDIDMVVRSGPPLATDVVPSPQIQAGRASVPVGVAGSSVAGGTAIPFTVFLSDGVVDAGAPSGHLLHAADMDNIPVVVAAFPDFDGDGFIGPTDLDGNAGTDNYLEVRELEPVGRGVALFSDGVARGTLAVHAGLPPSSGGLSVVLVALALTGPFDIGFYNGEVPSGPAISTALPFVPQHDLARLFHDRAVLVGPNTTLQEVIRFAALSSGAAPAPFALPLDGTSPSIDVAVVNSQPAVKAALFENIEPLGCRRHVTDVALGSRNPASKGTYRLMPTDRWGNPADPPIGFTAALVGTTPVKVQKPRKAAVLETASGLEARFKVKRGLADGTGGAMTIEVGGAVVDAVRYVVDSHRNLVRADVSVPSAAAPTIQAAIASAYDKRSDGLLVVDIAPGIYRENLVIDRNVVLRGHGAGMTIIQGDGSANAMSFSADGSSALGIAAIGGGVGVAVGAANVNLTDVAVWRSVGAGVVLSGAGASLSRVDSIDNGGDGITITANNTVCSEVDVVDNMGTGALLSATSGAAVADSRFVNNGFGAILLNGGGGAAISNNQLVNNLGNGIELNSSNANEVVGNMVVLGDGDGIHTDRTGANFISANVFEGNNGNGMYLRRSNGDDDFAAAAGVQAAPGDNTVSNNRQGEVFIRTN